MRIQRTYRGHVARERYGPTIANAVARTTRALKAIVDQLVDDFVTGDLVPAILLDVLTRRDDAYAPASAQEREAAAVYQQVLRRAVGEELTDVVRTEVRGMVSHYMRGRRETLPRNPLVRVAEGVVASEVRAEVEGMVRAAVRELAAEYVKRQRITGVVHAMLRGEMALVAAQAVEEEEEDGAVRTAVARGVHALCGTVAREAVEEAKGEADEARRAAQQGIIAQSARRVARRAMLRRLCAVLAGRGEEQALRERGREFVREVVARRLVDRAREAERNRRAAAANVPLALAMRGIGTVAAFTAGRSLLQDALAAWEREAEAHEAREAGASPK